MDYNLLISIISTIVIVFILLISINNKNKKQENRIMIYVLLLLVIVCFYFYKIGQFPEGLNQDEAGSMYDGVCIARYGYDRYLNKMPIYFTNYGDGQNPFFTYLFALCFKVANAFKTIDMSTISINKALLLLRLPTVIFNVLAFFIVFLTIRKEYDLRKAIISTIVIMSLPISFMHSRWSLESYYLYPMLIIASMSFIKGYNKQNSLFYFLSGLFYGFSLYTYAISYIIVPLTLGIMLLVIIYTKKFKVLNCVAFLSPIIILACPLIMFMIINYFDLNQFELLGFTITKLKEFRVGEVSFTNLKENLFELKFFKTILYDNANYNSYKTFSTIYYFNIPMLIFGLGISIKRIIKRKETQIIDYLALALLVSTSFAGLLTSDLNVNKINAVYVPLLFYITTAYIYLLKVNKTFFRIVIVVMIVNMCLFVNMYFSPNKDLKNFISVDYLKQIQNIRRINPDNSYLNYYKTSKKLKFVYIPLFSDDPPIDKSRKENYIFINEEFPFKENDGLYLVNINDPNVAILESFGYKKAVEGSLVLLYK